ncbi:amidophosphoribosyltransferase, partial [Enterococcus hirae]
ANYTELRDELLSNDQYHLARETDTEIIMHEICLQFSGDQEPTLIEMMRNVGKQLDGAYSIALLNANGDMLVARDPLGVKPLCYAKQGPL